jgi:hypothetical protein
VCDLIREPLPIGCVLSDLIIFSFVAERVRRELRFVELRPFRGIDVSSFQKARTVQPPPLRCAGAHDWGDLAMQRRKLMCFALPRVITLSRVWAGFENRYGV